MFCNLCLCVVFVMFVVYNLWVFKGVNICGFFNVWVCVCMCFVMCGCVYVWGCVYLWGFVMCGCAYEWVFKCEGIVCVGFVMCVYVLFL